MGKVIQGNFGKKKTSQTSFILSEQEEVLDFKSFKAKKEFEKDVSRGRTPLHITHLEGKSGKVTDSSYLNQNENEDFSGRTQRIRESLAKINSLMADLKKSGRTHVGPKTEQ